MPDYYESYIIDYIIINYHKNKNYIIMYYLINLPINLNAKVLCGCVYLYIYCSRTVTFPPRFYLKVVTIFIGLSNGRDEDDFYVDNTPEKRAVQRGAAAIVVDLDIVVCKLCHNSANANQTGECVHSAQKQLWLEDNCCACTGG